MDPRVAQSGNRSGDSGDSPGADTAESQTPQYSRYDLGCRGIVSIRIVAPRGVGCRNAVNALRHAAVDESEFLTGRSRLNLAGWMTTRITTSQWLSLLASSSSPRLASSDPGPEWMATGRVRLQRLPRPYRPREQSSSSKHQEHPCINHIPLLSLTLPHPTLPFPHPSHLSPHRIASHHLPPCR